MASCRAAVRPGVRTRWCNWAVMHTATGGSDDAPARCLRARSVDACVVLDAVDRAFRRRRLSGDVRRTGRAIPATVAAARANPRSMADRGIEEIVEHHKRYIGGLDERPILVGHSFGGLIVQRLLAEDFAVAGVAIDPAPIKGVLRLPVSSLKVAFPVLRKPANRHQADLAHPGSNSATGSETRSPRRNPTRFMRKWAIPGPGRPLFESAFAAVTLHSPAWVDVKNASRGPLLFIGGRPGPHGAGLGRAGGAPPLPKIPGRHRTPGVRGPRAFASPWTGVGRRSPTPRSAGSLRTRPEPRSTVSPAARPARSASRSNRRRPGRWPAGRPG